MSIASPATSQRLAEVFEYRSSQLAVRLVYSVAFFAVYGGLVGWSVAIGWITAYWALQLIERLAYRRGGPIKVWRSACLLFANSLTFGALAMFTPNRSQFEAVSLPLMLLVGGLLNSVLSSRRSKLTFVVNSLPFAIYLQLIDVKAYLVGADMGQILLMINGSVTFYIFVYLIWKSSAGGITAAAEARERAEAADAAKSIFLANMSHELRTPMNGVLGMAQVLRRSELTSTQREQVEMLQQSGDHLMGLLNDILDWSKIDAGNMAIAPTVTDLPGVLEQAASFWRPRAQDKGLELRLDLAPDLPRHVEIDPLRLKQILFNLIGNAAKFTATGSIAVSARVQATTPERLVFAVTDTGIGMAPEVLARLFARFAQASAETARTYGGTGLGLAISRRLAELMGGDLGVESVAGQGSVFTLTVPLVRAQSAQVAGETPDEDAARPMDVLTIDDHPVNLKVVELLLGAAGHRVVCARGADEGLSAAAGTVFDVILTDMHMPPCTGLDVLSALRSGSGPNRSTPVYVVTADAMQDDLARFAKHGFAGHVTKPIAAHDLFTVLNAIASEAPASSGLKPLDTVAA